MAAWSSTTSLLRETGAREMYWDSASRVLAEPAGIRTDPSTLQRPEGVLALDFVEGNVGIPGSTLPANAFSRYVGSPETTLNQDLWALGQGYGSIERLMDHLTQDLRGQPEGPGRRSGPTIWPARAWAARSSLRPIWP